MKVREREREREAMSKVLDRVQPKAVMSGRCQSKTNQDQNPTIYRTDTVGNENFVLPTIRRGVGDGRLRLADDRHTAGRRQAGNLPNPNLNLFAIIARGIWKRRNNVVHRGEFIHPTIVANMAWDELLQFTRANANEFVQVGNNTKAKAWD